MKTHVKASVLILLTFPFFMQSCEKIDNDKKKEPDMSTGKVISENIEDSDISSVKSEENNFFTGTFKIDDVFRYQSIYSSQNYDTFYELYAKCNINGEGYITSIDFKIINFKGPVNIGFSSSGEFKNELIHFEDKGVLGLSLIVKGLSNDYKKNVLLKKKIHKNSFTQFNVIRTLLPIDIKDNSPNSLRIYSNVFDDEFYYRSGLGTPQRRDPKPGHYDYNNLNKLNKKDYISQLSMELVDIKGNSGKCYKAHNFASN